MHDIPQETGQKWKIGLTLFFCILECLFFAATLTGWASIVYVFKEDGVFSHLCEDSSFSIFHGTDLTSAKQTLNNESSLPKMGDSLSFPFPRCSAQDRMFSLVFTVALLVWGAMGVPLGWFFDRYGLLKTRIISVTCGSTGFLLFAWAGSDQYTSYLLFPGSLLQVISAFITLLTCTHMAGLAGSHASTFVALCCGAGNSSILIYLVVKILHDEGISRNITITIVASLWILVLLFSLFMMPHFKATANSITDGPRSYTFRNNNSLDINCTNNGITATSYRINEGFRASCESVAQTNHSTLGEEEENTNLKPAETLTLWQCIKTLPYLFLNIWFSFLYLSYFTFIGTYNAWVTKLTDDDSVQVTHLTNVLAYCQLSSIVISLLPGIVTDYCTRRLTNRFDMTQGVATAPSLSVCSTMAAAVHVCVIVSRISTVYVVAIISEVARAFLFSSAVSFISITFPAQHYGKLVGISYFLTGIVNLLQYPLFIWADSSNSYFWTSIVLLGVSVLTYSTPIYMVLYRIKGSPKTN